MKGKTGIVVLVLVCIALGVGLLIRHAKAVQAQQDAEAKIIVSQAPGPRMHSGSANGSDR